MKQLLVLLLVPAILVCMLAGCSGTDGSVIHTHGELSIQLPQEFIDLGGNPLFADYTFIYGCDPVTVCGIREDRASLREYGMDPTLAEYTQLIIQAHGLDCQPLRTDGILYFNYEAGSPEPFTYVVTLWETPDAFWTVQAYCPSSEYPHVYDAIWQYVRSVTL